MVWDRNELVIVPQTLASQASQQDDGHITNLQCSLRSGRNPPAMGPLLLTIAEMVRPDGNGDGGLSGT